MDARDGAGLDDGLKDRLFAGVFLESEDAVLGVDASGTVRVCSKGAAALAGRAAGEVVGRGLDALFEDGAGCRGILDSAREVSLIKNFDAVLAAGDGRRQKALMTVRALAAAGGAVVGFLVHLSPAAGESEGGTDARAMQDALVRMERFSAVGRMAAAFAHEMRSPLHVISSTAEFAMEFLSPDPKVRDGLDMILRNARYAARSVQALLDFAKVGRSHLKECSLNDAVGNALALAEKMCRARGIEVDLQLGTVPSLLLDEQHMRAVAHNLLVNAIEAMPGKGTLAVRTGVQPDGAVCFEVRDTGAGMSDEVLAKAGSPFFTTKENGTGLGLYLAKRIVAEHGAALSITSEKGRGTTVAVRFAAVPSK